jgi:citrate synthase
MGVTAKLIIDGETFELPIIEGTEGERAIDISKLRQETGLIALDPGYANTGSCESSITFMNEKRGSSDIEASRWINWRSIPLLWKRHIY